MDQSAPNQFRIALAYLLSQKGRGAQTHLANQLGIDRGYLNAIVKGRKAGSEEKRRIISAYFNMHYEEVLMLGRRILDGNENPTIEESDTAESLPKNHNTENSPKEIFSLAPPPTHEKGSEDISAQMVKAIQLLGSDTKSAKLLAGIIEVLHDCVNTKNENQKLKDDLKVIQQRITSLERKSLNEEELIQKTA